MLQKKSKMLGNTSGIFLPVVLGILLIFSPDLWAQAPSITGLSISSSSGNNTNDDTLTCAYTFSGPAITAATAWYKNSVPLMTIYLPFEGGATNALKDFSGNNYLVTGSGTPVWSATSGRDGFGGVAFGGTSYLNAGKVFPTKSSYTQTAWIYRTSSGTYDFIFGGRDQSSHGFRASADQRISAGQNGNMRIVQGYPQSLTSNRWTFVAVTFDYVTGTMILYQDGQPIDTAIVAVSSRNMTDSTLQIGAIGGTNNWKGRLDDIRIYNYPLNGEQIKLLYDLHGADKISPAETSVNDTWQARVTPFSSSDIGATYESNILAIVPTAPAFISTPVINGIEGKLYTYIARATGGPTPIYQLSISPAGMTIDSVSGIIRWYPASAGIYSVMISAVNSVATTVQNYTINVAEPTVGLSNVAIITTAGDSLACSYNPALQATAATTAWYKNGVPLMTLYMPFEGGATFALDDASGNNITAMPIGNPVWSANGGRDGNGCFTYDGNSYLIAGNIFPTRSSYTKSAWIYRTTTNEYNHILSGWDHNTAASGGHGLRVSADQRLSAGQNGNWRIVQTNAGTIVSNRWYFAAVTFNYASNEMVLYLDGVAVNSAVVASAERDVTDPGVLVGATQGSFAWKGKIDDARIYNYALTPQQIAALFNNNGGNRIVAQETKIGDVWQARVIPYSATEAGTPYPSNMITIGNVNHPPVLAAIGPKTVAEGQNLNFNDSASDVDGTTPALTTSTRPANASFTDNGNGTGTFTFNPDYSQAGTYNISFFASDGALLDTEVVNITVVNSNRSPVLAAIGARSIVAGSTLAFTVTASDPDNEIATLQALNLPPNASFVDNANNSGAFAFSPTLAQAGVYDITFKAVDPAGAVDSEIVAITVIDNSAPANWSATIAVTGEVIGTALNSAQVIIGIGDSEKVSYAAPRPPEYTASMQLWRGSDGPYFKDIEKSGGKCYYWTIEVDPHGNVAPPATARCAVVSWNAAELSPGRHYVLHEGLNPDGPVVVADMRTTAQYQICDVQVAHYFTIHWEDASCGGKVYADVALNAGWNLISLPVIPQDSSLAVLFPTAQIAYEYNGQYLEATKLVSGKGYWLKVPSAATVTLFGRPFTGYTTALTPGWYLKGAPDCAATPQTNPAGQLSEAFGFNNAYQPAAQFTPGMGYWVKISGTCDLSVNCGGPGKFLANMDESARRISIHAKGVDLGGVNEADIVIGVGAQEEIATPPPDAPQYSIKMELYRTGWSGPYFADIQSRERNDNSWIIAVNPHGNMLPNGQKEIVISWNPDELGGDAYALREGADGTGSLLVDDMHKIGEYSFKPGDGIKYLTVVRKAGTAVLPNAFHLAQNYPNPFNPSTSIEYSIGKQTEVTIAVFNMLGQKVKDLVNGTQPAGDYRVTWDGADNSGMSSATGIYFYRMQAGDYMTTRKMLLMK